MPTMIDVLLPADQAEGTRSQVLRWLKAVGEPVAKHEPLVEIETDKVTIEVSAPADGVLGEIAAAEGTDVAPGALLGRLHPGSAATVAAAVVAQPSIPVTASPAAPAAVSNAAGQMSPAVRRLLAERGLTADAVQGSGEGGRITVEDVLAARKASVVTPPPDEAGLRRIPHTPMRRRIAAHMVESLLQTAPHVTTVFQADMTAVLAHRAKTSFTLTAYFVAACVDAIRAVPEVNGRWTDDAILVSDRIEIGVGTALEGRGLIVPVIRDAGSLDLAGIAAALGELVARARDGPADACGPSRRNLHDLQPRRERQPGRGADRHQPAAVGDSRHWQAGEARGRGRDGRRKDSIVIRPCCYVTLTIDHRVLDGYQANLFMQTLVRRIEGWT